MPRQRKDEPVSADELFGTIAQGPDEDLRLQFEAVLRFNEDEKKVRSVRDGLLLTHEARKWPAGAATAKENSR